MVSGSTRTVLDCERRHEDLERPVTLAIAARDVVGAGINDTVSLVRIALAGRSRTATREAPYNDIFEKRIGEYTEANIDDKAEAVALLIHRMEAYLPEDDPVRVQYVPVLAQQLGEWAAACAAIVTERQDLDVARKARDNALVAWDAMMEEVYGLLVARVGKDVSDRYFVRSQKKRKPVVEPAAQAVAPSSQAAPSAAAPPPTPPASTETSNGTG